jgi:PTH1 family peptidyl-tRNA hydrolase
LENEFSKGKQADFVLGKWTSEEQKIVDERIKVAAEAIKSFAFIGFSKNNEWF